MSPLCPSCALPQPVPDDEPDFFALLGVERRFDVDSKGIETAFKAAQRALHPDRFEARRDADDGRKSIGLASDASALFNKAAATLRNPVERAMYLLASVGCDLEEVTLSDEPALLMEVLEMREEVEGSRDVAELEGIIARAGTRVAATEAAFTAAIDAGESALAAAQRAAIEMKYWHNIRAAAEEAVAKLEHKAYSDRV